MIGGRRPLPGRKPADRRVRVDRPHSPYFRYTGPGQMVAKEAASRPTDAGRQGARPGPRHRLRSAARKRGGDRRAAGEAEGARDLQLGRDLVVSAYATEEILKVLIRAGAGALAYSIGVSVAITVLLAVVRYQLSPGLPGLPQRRRRLRRCAVREPVPAARPDRRGGAPHRLRHDSGGLDVLGRSSRSIDRARQVNDIRIEIAFVSIALITIGNLRGLRESGNIFAIPTYLFVGLALLMIAGRRLPHRDRQVVPHRSRRTSSRRRRPRR